MKEKSTQFANTLWVLSQKGLAQSLGFPQGFFSSRTAYRFFASFNGWNINRLEEVNLQLLKEQLTNWYPSTSSVFIDLDMNTKSVEGKRIEKATLLVTTEKALEDCLSTGACPHCQGCFMLRASKW